MKIESPLPAEEGVELFAEYSESTATMKSEFWRVEHDFELVSAHNPTHTQGINYKAVRTENPLVTHWLNFEAMNTRNEF